MGRVDRAVLAALTPVLLLSLCVPIAAAAQQSTRLKVERSDQLPRHSYRISTTATALFQDDQQFAALAQQVAADLRADLTTYDIQDHATLKSYYGILGNLALERADYKTAVSYQDSIGAVEDKPGLRLSGGILERALAAAAGPPGEPLDTARFREAFRGQIAALSYPGGEVALTAMKRRFGLLPNPLRQLQNRIEPSAGSGSLTLQLAERLIAMRVVRDRIAPVRDIMLAELDGIMASHKTNADIWAARAVSLDGRTDLTPVTMAIWDSGVDVALYPGQLFTNAREIADNGKDDDGNGYIDDVHGIAYDLEHGRVTGMLDSVKPVPHGTHVAGIAVRGNPAARMLVARRSEGMGGTQNILASVPPPTMERARAFAQEMRETIEYFRQHGVRVVNMSFGFHPGAYETNLAAHNIGTPEERRRLARQIFNVAATALHDAMAAASNMLFVAAAGNWDSDNKFDEFVPASFDLPNLITVGAVDAAGDETSFTSYGKVDVYANGYQVSSQVPGGATVPMSGTSMATPQVVNLAAKLLAVKPTLTTAELRRAILESADEKTIGQGKTIRLLNPKAAFQRIMAR